MIKLYINNKTSFKFNYKEKFENIFELVSKEFKVDGDSELSLIIIDNKEMRSLNHKYRDKDYTTDVLSFPQGGLKLGMNTGIYLMGDIFISYEKIIEQSKEFGHNEEREWCYIFTHGVLHLFGLDHIEKEEEKEMNELAKEIMLKIKVGR